MTGDRTGIMDVGTRLKQLCSNTANGNSDSPSVVSKEMICTRMVTIKAVG